MSERLPRPTPSRFPDLADDPRWVREVPAGTILTRIFRAGGIYPTQWHEFREFGPLDARFDPHPEPVGVHPHHGVMYAALGTAFDTAADQRQDRDLTSGTDSVSDSGSNTDTDQHELAQSALAVCLLEVFQQHRIVRRTVGAPTLAIFSTTRTLRLLDLSDSDWITVAGGNAAIASGEHAESRTWARSIRERYPKIDGIVAASSLVPSARITALWNPALSAIPEHALALIRLDRDELTGVIDAIAERYGYLLLP